MYLYVSNTISYCKGELEHVPGVSQYKYYLLIKDLSIFNSFPSLCFGVFSPFLFGVVVGVREGVVVGVVIIPPTGVVREGTFKVTGVVREGTFIVTGGVLGGRGNLTRNMGEL